MGKKEVEMKAVVLLSGGLDSCVTGGLAKREYDEIFALTFFYGQSHSKELESAKRIAEYLNVEEHKITQVDVSLFSTSSLVGDSDPIPQRKLEEIKNGVPSTYVPARNIIFLSYALAYGENIDADAVFIGVNAIDYSGYPDCRQEFIKAFQKVADVGTKKGVEARGIQIKAPLIHLTKAEIIKKGLELQAPLHLTWSCYRGKEKACGRCDSCLLRLKGFKEAGYKDPLEYENYPSWYNKINWKFK